MRNCKKKLAVGALRTVRWVCETRGCGWGKPEGERPFGRHWLLSENNINVNRKETGWGTGNGLIGSGHWQMAGFCECGNEHLDFIKCGDFLVAGEQLGSQELSSM